MARQAGILYSSRISTSPFDQYPKGLIGMVAEPAVVFQSLTDSEEPPAKRSRVMDTPPAEADEPVEMHGLSKRFDTIRAGLESGHEDVLTASWERILCQIREELGSLTEAGPEVVTEIEFQDLRPKPSETAKADSLLRDLKIRGAAVIRNIIPRDEAAAWTHELDNYLRDNPHTKTSPPENPELYELFWSVAQLKVRAHPNMLSAQKFLMSSCWHNSSKSGDGLSSNFPVTYADRVRMPQKSLRGSGSRSCMATPPASAGASVGAGVDAQWKLNSSHGGFSPTATYREIWSGDWESYDPWESSARLGKTDDLHNDERTSSVFKMFEGILPLSTGSSDDGPPMHVCSLPLKLTTAYQLLRPLFSPKRPSMGSTGDFFNSLNWILDTTQGSHNQAPRSASLLQDLNGTLHSRLALEKTLIPLPPVNAGDYVIWHPDTVYTTPLVNLDIGTPSPFPDQLELETDTSWAPTKGALPSSSSALLNIPTCPLTQNNAKYLVRQRKAFLLGFPGPDFCSTHAEGCGEIGESCHMGRPGVQEINETGGEEALRAMGLLAWEEDDAFDAGEKGLLIMANALLFPGRI